VLLPFDGPLVEDLKCEVVFGDVPVLRRELLSVKGGARLARQMAAFQPFFARLLSEREPDVVHANTSVILGLRHHAPRLVTHVREIYPPTPVLWPLHRRQILASDAVICVSQAAASALRVAPATLRSHVVHDGLTFDPLAAPRDEARRTLGLPPTAFIAAVLGRISSWKGQELLARAIQHVDGGLALIAGDAWPGQERHEHALLPFHRVHRAGFVDPNLIYGAADVVVVPSTQPDPLPNSAIEAAAAGCCVVAANHGGLPEIIEDGATGRLFPPGDANALAAILGELRDSPLQCQKFGAAAKHDAKSRFDPHRMRAEIDAVYAMAREPATAATPTTTQMSTGSSRRR
jgi:glycosyltransferase involved in cell wall biosynthesis